MTYTEEDCKKETVSHIFEVRKYLEFAMKELEERGRVHDLSKLKSPELEIFTEYTPRLKKSTYGSEEYKENLKEMKVALEHHYANNRHHPEHFKLYTCKECLKEYKKHPHACDECFHVDFKEESDISQMNLFDLIEMVCDWMAAVMRHENGDIMKSLDINSLRFGISDQLTDIIKNTIEEMK